MWNAAADELRIADIKTSALSVAAGIALDTDDAYARVFPDTSAPPMTAQEVFDKARTM